MQTENKSTALHADMGKSFQILSLTLIKEKYCRKFQKLSKIYVQQYQNASVKDQVRKGRKKLKSTTFLKLWAEQKSSESVNSKLHLFPLLIVSRNVYGSWLDLHSTSEVKRFSPTCQEKSTRIPSRNFMETSKFYDIVKTKTHFHQIPCNTIISNSLIKTLSQYISTVKVQMTSWRSVSDLSSCFKSK